MANRQAKSLTISKDGDTYTIRGLTAAELTHLNNAITEHQDISGKLDTTLKGAANGLAELDSVGKVPSSQLPSYVDDVVEYASASAFPATGESGKIYVAKDTNKVYRWSGSSYVVISETLALGETSSTAYRGDRGKTAYDHASDSNKISAAQSEGMYKMAVTSEGHIKSVSAITKSDITNLGIPGNHQDISGKADKVSSATNDNFAALDTNGNLKDSGHKHSDYLTSHQDISGKADKVSGATSGNFASLDSNGNLQDSGHKHSDYLTSHQDISGKADKVSSATNDNFAALDANGNLKDSGHKHSDYLTSHQDISGKADKVSGATSGNFASLDSNGNLQDSGHKHSDYLTAAEVSGKADKVSGATSGNFASLDSNGNLQDSGHKHSDYIPMSAKGTNSGVAELDATGKVPSSQLPSYVDDVVEGYYYNSKFYEESTHITEITPETGKIYIDLSTDKTYRWGGSAYVVIASDLALGETSSTAYRGDRGKTAYDHATDSSRLTTAQTSGLYKVAVSSEGHVASVAAVAKSDITALGIPGQDTTYSEATQSASGLMSSTDKTKLDGIESGAQVNPSNQTICDLVYPVGSIYMSVNSTSPATLFGGTWEQMKDKFLLGAGDTYTAGNTGGAASQSYTPAGTVGGHTLTSDEIPSHSHGLNSHTHSVGAHSHGLNSHTHTGPSHTHTGPSHTHSVGAHSHGLNSHKHTYTDYYANTTSGSTTLTTEQIPSHSHKGYGNGKFAMMTGNTTPNIIRCDSNGATSAENTAATGGGKGHTHSVSNTSTSRTSDAASGSTANSTAFDSGAAGTGNTGAAGTGNTGAASGSTANSTAFDSGAATGNTAATGGGGSHNHSFTGTQATINTMPPYLVVYMWKRTA